MHETTALKEQIQTLEMAFESIERQKDLAGRPTELTRFAYAPLTTTCAAIPKREVELVETDDSLVIWGTMTPDAWLQRADWAVSNGAVAIDQVALQNVGGGTIMLPGGRPPKAKRLQGPGVFVDYLYHETYRGYDGMFRVVVQKNSGATQQDRKQLLETGFGVACGDAIFSPYNVEESNTTYKHSAYGTHYKIGAELNPTQEAAADALEVIITNKGRKHLVDRTKPIDERIEGVRHEFLRADSVIGMLLDGELLSTAQRIITGSFYAGRSSGADILNGGSDSVYNYLQVKGYPESLIKRPTVLFSPTVLQRVDIRGYDNDAYGSRERENPDALDVRFGRTPPDKTDTSSLAVSYEKRVHPEEFVEKLRGVHELCAETSIGTEYIDKIIVPSDPTDWFDDTRWGVVLAGYAANTHQVADTLRSVVANDGKAAGIQFLAKGLGMPQGQAEYYLSGVDYPSMKDRLIKKLSILNVADSNGRKIEDVIVEARSD